jgi:Mrp family chromosome partitioning ATPase
VGLPEVGERQDALLRFLWPGVLPRLVGEIDVQDVEDEDVTWMAVPIARGSVLAGKVLGKRPLSPRAVLSSAARADLTRSVADDPGCVTDELATRVALL